MGLISRVSSRTYRNFKIMSITIKIEFGGGSEYLFGNKKNLEVTFENSKNPATVQDLLDKMRTEFLQEREELFFQDKTVRPGVLVLVNDTDWEILGSEEYELEDKDVISFISTLHGG